MVKKVIIGYSLVPYRDDIKMQYCMDTLIRKQQIFQNWYNIEVDTENRPVRAG